MEKEDLRKEFKEKRRSLSSEEREQMSIDISQRLLKKFDLSGYNISIFLPITRLSEINTWHIIENLSANYVLPVVTQEGELEHIVYESQEQLKVSDWGIPEPTYGEKVRPEILDIVLIPLLAVDRDGNRVGYGKGFYDGFLSQCSEDCIFIGLSYFDPVEVISDTNARDIPLHFCVTPNQVVVF